MRGSGLVALAVLLIGMLAVPPANASISHERKLRKAMIEQINKARVNRGRAPLRPSRSLIRSSRAFSRWQMRRDYFGHVSRIRASRRFERLGEVLAFHWGRRARIRRTGWLWLNSSAHRAIILSRSFRRIGAGVAKGRFRGRRAVIWTVQVGA